MSDLRKLLDEATPGPWEAALEPKCHGVVASINGQARFVALIGNDTDTPEREPMRFANASMIAMAPDLAAALLEAEKMAVKVKPLEWSPCEEWKQCSKERAPAFGGEYQIVLLDPKDDKRTSLYFEIGLGAFMFRFEQGEPDELGPTGPKKYPTVDAAKAAAQADYERRILSAVEAVPASQIRAEALREALAAAIRVIKDGKQSRRDSIVFDVEEAILALIDAPKVTTSEPITEGEK